MIKKATAVRISEKGGRIANCSLSVVGACRGTLGDEILIVMAEETSDHCRTEHAHEAADQAQEFNGQHEQSCSDSDFLAG